jgi:Flp pilus assembly protein TadG
MPACPMPACATPSRSRSGHLWRRLGSDRRGLAALEFALIAPILVMAYLATAEASLALMAQRKLSLSASIAADLASHSATINVQTVNGIFAATTAVLDPFDATTLAQRLTGIVVDPGGVARVEWSVGAGMEALVIGSEVALPANLVVADEGIVMAETALDYASPMAFTLPGTRQFSETHFVYPRVNDRVLWE